MNTSSRILSSALIAAASLCAAGAFASDGYPGAPARSTADTVSNTTRAQVRADYLQAKRDGSLFRSDDSYPTTASAQPGGKTRAEVRSELINAMHQGYSPRIDNSYPGDMAQGAASNRTHG